MGTARNLVGRGGKFRKDQIFSIFLKVETWKHKTRSKQTAMGDKCGERKGGISVLFEVHTK